MEDSHPPDFLQNIDLSSLPEHVVLKSNNGATVFLIGTAHISEQSATDVRRIIRALRPTSVLIELCTSRLALADPERLKLIFEEREKLRANGMTEEEIVQHIWANGIPEESLNSHENNSNEATESGNNTSEEPNGSSKDENQDQNSPNSPSSSDSSSSPPPEQTSSSFLKNLKRTLGKQGGLMAIAISYMYQSISSQVKLNVGEDMRTAAEEAAYIGSNIILGDRPIVVTLARAWGGLSGWKKIQLVYECIKVSLSSIKSEDIEMLKNKDILTEFIKELSSQYPSLCQHLLTERDLYLAAKLREIPGPVVVGVVGLGHINGIKENWNNPIDLKSLMITPPVQSWKSFFVKLFAVFSVLVAFFAWLLHFIFWS